jgi:hypothetical protein
VLSDGRMKDRRKSLKEPTVVSVKRQETLPTSVKSATPPSSAPPQREEPPQPVSEVEFVEEKNEEAEEEEEPAEDKPKGSGKVILLRLFNFIT